MSPSPAPSLDLGLHQGLRQRMAPMQVAYGRMLEMTGPEVEEEVRRTLDENPALEAVDLAPSADTDADTGVNERSYYTGSGNSGYDIIENLTEAHPPTEAESLETQLSERSLPERIARMAHYVIGNLDSNGYLTRTANAMATDIAVAGDIPDPEPAEMQQAIEAVQSLDPAGIGARDLQECLLLQLRRLPENGPRDLAIGILTDQYDSFTKMHFDRIMAKRGIDRETMTSVLDLIRTLNPKPGNAISTGITPADRLNVIVPDFMIENDGEQLTLTLLNNIPELRIEQSFLPDNGANEDSPSATPGPAREFAARRREEAATFIKLLKMRSETLFRIMSAILKIQRAFFITGDETRIRPMILKDVAAITGYDLSVISRSTAGKYVTTANGIYPLKMFFNERPKDDADTTTIEILDALKRIIESEDHSRPLSDDALRSRLAEEGYDLARRTVTKYREKLKLPVARLRKRI